MAARSFNVNQQLEIEQELETENSPENSSDSPRGTMSVNDTKIPSTSSSKRSRRATEKRVISVPIKDIEGFRIKGDHMSAPPSDSWAWRKYGQKPIKGSPYPRGYYRCSSSKGCPARKQVERSRVDPNLLVVTYSCEHNHSSPASNPRNVHHHINHNRNVAATHSTRNVITTTTTTMSTSEEDEDGEEDEEEEEKKPTINKNFTHQSQEQVPEYKFVPLGTDQGATNEFRWFDFEPTLYCTMLECPILTEDKRVNTENEMAMIFTMGEEDESLFADLGELPECSTVFR